MTKIRKKFTFAEKVDTKSTKKIKETEIFGENGERRYRFDPTNQRRYFNKLLKSPGIDSKKSIQPAYAACAGILEQSMGARNRVGIGLSYWSARLHRLEESIPWNRFDSWATKKFKNTVSGGQVRQPYSIRTRFLAPNIISTRFLSPMDCSKIPALSPFFGTPSQLIAPL
jgi:hypothetical protein